MNKVITINLNGNAYPLEENGYEALRAYLDTAARRLEGNPDKAEIIADIEQAIADKFRTVLGTNKTVVVTAEVAQVIAEMGPVEDASAPAADSPGGAADGRRPEGAPEARAAEPAGAASGPAKRLYRIKDGAMIAGVCHGIAAYLNLDVTVVRVLFALLVVLTWGVIGVPLYILLAILLPAAHTSAEKAAAYGAPSTAEEFIRRAREGYYEGMRTFHDKAAHRQWKRRFKQDMRAWKRSFQREMQGHAHPWQQQWHNAWAPSPRPNFLAWIFVPIISVIIWAVAVVAVIAVASLLLTGAVFGVLLPHGVPLWIGIVVLIVAFNVLVWPLKALRHSFFWGSGQAYPYGGGGSVAWLAFLVLVVWLTDRHVPEFHRALENLPPVIHHAVDSVRQWWDQR